MLKNKIQISSLLVLGITTIVTGIMIFNAPKYFLIIVYYSLSTLFSGIGLLNIILSIISKDPKARKYSQLINGLGLLITGIVIYLHPENMLSVFHFIIGFFGLITSIVCFINYYVYKQDNLKGRLFILIEAIIFFVFSLLLIIRPYIQGIYVYRLIGAYLFIFGLSNIQNFIIALFPNIHSKKIKIPLPVFMNILLPQKLVKYINNLIRKSGIESDELKPVRNKNTPYDMEILIHLGDKGFDSVGHVDIAFKDIVLSYGCHDHHKTKLGGALGPGVIHFDEKTSYINFVTNIRNKSLIGFGIHLEDFEKKNVLKSLNELASRFRPWLSDQDKKDQGLEYHGDCQNYASLLTYHVHSKFYKFIKGKFKTYFVFTTNCCLLADTLVGKSGLDLIKFTGIVTPGTYYEYLNSEFIIPNAKVVSRTIYTKENSFQLKPNPKLNEAIRNIIDPIIFINENIFKEE